MLLPLLAKGYPVTHFILLLFQLRLLSSTLIKKLTNRGTLKFMGMMELQRMSQWPQETWFFMKAAQCECQKSSPLRYQTTIVTSQCIFSYVQSSWSSFPHERKILCERLHAVSPETRFDMLLF